MGEYEIKGLQRSVEALQNTIGSILQEILAVLRPIQQLPRDIKAVRETLVNGFSDQINATFMTALLEKISSMKGKEEMIESQRQRLGKRTNRFHTECEKVKSRSSNSMLDQRSRTRKQINEIDGPVMNLLANYGFAVIDDTSRYALPSWEMFDDQNNEHDLERRRILRYKIAPIMEKIEMFLQKRRHFQESVVNVIWDKPDDMSPYYLPVVKLDGDVLVAPETRDGGISYSSGSTAWQEKVQSSSKDLFKASNRGSNNLLSNLGVAIEAELADIDYDESEFIMGVYNKSLSQDVISITIPGYKED